MPVFQTIAEPELAQKYRLKALGCERQSKRAADQATQQRWLELAAQWHSMADQAAKMLRGACPQEFLTSAETDSDSF